MMLELIVCGLFPGSHVFDRYGKYLPGVNDMRTNAVGFTESAKAHTVGAGNGTQRVAGLNHVCLTGWLGSVPDNGRSAAGLKGRRTSLWNGQLLPHLES